MKTILFFGLLGFCACNAHHDREGTAERAGRHIDEAADSVHDSAVRSKENLKEMGRDVKNRVRQDDDAEDRRERDND